MSLFDRWLLRVTSIAVIVLALFFLVDSAVSFALWRRDVTATLNQLLRQQPPPAAPAPAPPAPAKAKR